MSIALGALQAQQAGMQATTNNLANLNTPGYSRELPVLEEADPVVQDNIAFGGGVELEGVQSLRTTCSTCRSAKRRSSREIPRLTSTP